MNEIADGIIYSEQINLHQEMIDLNNQPTGIYFCQINSYKKIFASGKLMLSDSSDNKKQTSP